MPRKIAIVGAGFAGMGAAFYLKQLQPDLEVSIFEGDAQVGGLAQGFKMPEWDWSVERFVHHWFSTDKIAFDVAEAVGLKDDIILRSAKSSCYSSGRIAQFDSAWSVLNFPFLSMADRFRAGLATALIKFLKKPEKYEGITAYDYLRKMYGEKAFDFLWKPLFEGKFGHYAPQINAAWFAARIYSRTKKLAYVKGGFQAYVNGLAEHLSRKGTKILLNSPIEDIRRASIQPANGQSASAVNGQRARDRFQITAGSKTQSFDALIMTSPLSISLKLFDFPEDFKKRYSNLTAIGAQYFVLELQYQFLEDGTYWLNVNEAGFPFMVIAEHTNFIDKKHYGNKRIIWVGKYLEYGDPLWSMPEAELLALTCSFLKKINQEFEESRSGPRCSQEQKTLNLLQ